MDPEAQAYLAGLISFARIGPHPGFLMLTISSQGPSAVSPRL